MPMMSMSAFNFETAGKQLLTYCAAWCRCLERRSCLLQHPEAIILPEPRRLHFSTTPHWGPITRRTRVMYHGRPTLPAIAAATRSDSTHVLSDGTRRFALPTLRARAGTCSTVDLPRAEQPRAYPGPRQLRRDPSKLRRVRD
jgi:hypothetical protein